MCNLEELGKSSVQVEFAIKHMAGVFVVGGFGLACSVSFFLFKKFYILNRSQGKNKDEDKKPEKKLLDNQENSDKRTTILQSAWDLLNCPGMCKGSQIEQFYNPYLIWLD